MTTAKDKPIFWVGSSNLKPADFKPMPDVGRGVEELRIRTTEAFRVFYVARFEDTVYVLHAFPKKTQKTSKRDLDIGRWRYKEMLRHRESLS